MFTEYEHMENHYNLVKYYQDPCSKKYIDPTIKWYATEKIHGTNFSFITDGIDVTPAKRGSSLGDNRSYYGCGPICVKYKQDILTLFSHLILKYHELESIQLYGELFGGAYNGKSDPGCKSVQANMNYCPFNDFMAFDLKMIVNKKIFYLDFCDLIEIFNNLNLQIKLIPIINTGTLDELLSLNPKFESIVYQTYGLNKIENNFAEGFVIHPSKELIQDNTRINFKFKNPSFSEVIIKQPKDKSITKTLTFAQECLESLKLYITDNRFDNIYSKLDDNELQDDKILIDMMINDIIVDYQADHNDSNDFIHCNDNIESNKQALRGNITGYIGKKLNRKIIIKK